MSILVSSSFDISSDGLKPILSPSVTTELSPLKSQNMFILSHFCCKRMTCVLISTEPPSLGGASHLLVAIL